MTPARSETRARLDASSESGVALVVAIEVMLVLGLLAVAVIAAGSSLGSSTLRDASSTRALATANAGLEIARYRLNRIQPANCLTDRSVATGSGGAAAGECPAFSGSMGNGATYKYWVTPPITASNVSCASVPTVPATTAADQRCITAAGTVNGVTRRVQALVGAQLGRRIFPLSGIVGLDGIAITENGFGNINGPLGSNGALTLKGCQSPGVATTWDPGPGSPGATATGCSVQAASPVRTAPYTLEAVDPIYAGTELAANNDNSIFTAGSIGASTATGFSYNASTRSLADNTTTALTLDGPNPRANSGGVWVFNVCSLNFTHAGTQIRLLNGAQMKLLVDSSSRAGSGCSSAGSITISNTSCFNMVVCASPGTPGNPADLQIYQYSSSRIDVSNQAGFSAALYAPNAEVKFTNKSTFYGAIAAKKITATNGLDFYGGDVSGIRIGGSGLYLRARPGWTECSSVATTSTDPESGC